MKEAGPNTLSVVISHEEVQSLSNEKCRTFIDRRHCPDQEFNYREGYVLAYFVSYCHQTDNKSMRKVAYCEFSASLYNYEAGFVGVAEKRTGVEELISRGYIERDSGGTISATDKLMKFLIKFYSGSGPQAATVLF